MRKITVLAIVAMAVIGLTASFMIFWPRLQPTTRATPTTSATPTPTPQERVETYTIQPGDTFGLIAEQVGITATNTIAILKAAADLHPLETITAGRVLHFTFRAADNTLQQVVYEINSEDTLSIEKNETEWKAERKPIAYEIRQAQARGEITSSLYETILEQGYDERLAIALAEVFAWQVDFAVDVRAGDTFRVLYEQRYRDGKYAMPGNILKATFTNAGQTFTAYHFATGTTTDGYFEADGKSLLRLFLKSPLAYRYISSGYTGARRDPITKKIGAHYAIDYAAAFGTPVVAVGDGTVTQAGWNGGYGISVTVRHNETYATRYGHFSRLAKGIRSGVKIKQNQVIGYVGSTGHSTGPHLHYEMYRRGAKVNPYKVDVPAGSPVSGSMRESFAAEVKRLDALMPTP